MSAKFRLNQNSRSNAHQNITKLCSKIIKRALSAMLQLFTKKILIHIMLS